MSKICDDTFDDEIMDLSEDFREVMEDLTISRISGVPIYMLRYEPIDMMSSDDSEEEDE